MKKTIVKQGKLTMNSGAKVVNAFKKSFPNAEVVSSSTHPSPTEERELRSSPGVEKRDNREHVYSLPNGTVSIKQTAVYRYKDTSHSRTYREWVHSDGDGYDNGSWGTEEKTDIIQSGSYLPLGIERIAIKLTGSPEFLEDMVLLNKLENILREVKEKEF
jgi:hypothetical protein